MSEDFDRGLQGNPPGAGDPSDTPPQDTPRRVNVFDTPEGRQYQQLKDREAAQIREEARQAREEADRERSLRLQREAELAGIGQALQNVEPDDLEYIEQQRKLGYLSSRVQQLEAAQEEQAVQAEARTNFWNFHIRLAQRMGIDPYTPHYQRALEAAWNQPDSESANLYMENIRTMARSGAGKQDEDALAQRKEELEARVRAGQYTTGPGGGQRPIEKAADQRKNELKQKIKAAKGNERILSNLQVEYADLYAEAVREVVQGV